MFAKIYFYKKVGRATIFPKKLIGYFRSNKQTYHIIQTPFVLQTCLSLTEIYTKAKSGVIFWTTKQ